MTEGWTLRGRRGRGRVPAALAVLVALLLAGHVLVPNTGPRLGSLLETFLPWLGLAVPLLAGAALLARSVAALLAALLPLGAWLGVFGPALLPAQGGHDLTVLQHNVSDENPDPEAAARALLSVRADLLALEEVTPAALPRYRAVLDAAYPYHARSGTVALWSRLPLRDARPLDIRPAGVPEDWQRGLRATAATARGDVAVYVVHLPSVRIGAGGLRSARRDQSAARLGHLLAAEAEERVVLLGDLNGTVQDRGLAPLTSRLDTPRSGLAPSWPAGLPLARIDHVLARAATVTRIGRGPATGSDHLPVVGKVRL
ncbi:endonuclease/exonuclease/phosphatase family protein [Streptomyces sp. NPDC001941]|uniref:endonuclease/exonuclease/phosphatase family protein n=1 Tax=Streptomyces sp. NPDC001941 TaxID=3154659 RepID=UPI00332F5D1C